MSTMTTEIEIKHRSDEVAIYKAMSDPAIYAFVVVMGHLGRLDSDRARWRVLSFVADAFDEASKPIREEVAKP